MRRPIMLALLFFCLPAQAAVTQVQQLTPSVAAHWTTGGNAPVDLPVAATSGNLITVEVAFGDGAGVATVSSVDDAGTTSYACERTQGDTAQGVVVAICWGIAAGAGAGTDVVVTWSTTGSSADDMIAVQEWAGNDATQASLSDNGANTAAATSHDSGSVTPGTTDNVLIAVSRGSSRSWTMDADFTSMLVNNRTTLGYRLQSSDTAGSYTVLSDIAGFADLAIVAFKGTASASGALLLRRRRN